MRRTRLFVTLGGIVAMAAFGAGAIAPRAVPESSEIEQLKKEIALLEQRVESLEKRLADNSLRAAVENGRQSPDVINPYLGVRPVPRNWKKGEFNGMPYYIVPIDKGPAPAPEPQK
jgi:hypothetical protein